VRRVEAEETKERGRGRRVAGRRVEGEGSRVLMTGMGGYMTTLSRWNRYWC